MVLERRLARTLENSPPDLQRSPLLTQISPTREETYHYPTERSTASPCPRRPGPRSSRRGWPCRRSSACRWGSASPPASACMAHRPDDPGYSWSGERRGEREGRGLPEHTARCGPGDTSPGNTPGTPARSFQPVTLRSILFLY